MRAAGVPARVVVGYLGGEFNPAENYLLVRQRDAHAWAEIWLEGQGWIRVDPTAAVAPERIEQGLGQSLSAADAALVAGAGNIDVLNWLALRVDAWSYNWHRLVLSYDDKLQGDVFRRLLGGTDIWRVAVFFVGGSLLLLGGYFTFSLWPARRIVRSPEARIYRVHLLRLARRGYRKLPAETPLQFAERIGKMEPEWAADLLRVAHAYNTSSYTARNAPSDLIGSAISNVGATINNRVNSKTIAFKSFESLVRSWRPK